MHDTIINLRSDEGEVPDEVFNEVFRTFDTDMSGYIEKEEMVYFIK